MLEKLKQIQKKQALQVNFEEEEKEQQEDKK
jgi:hypothetical protein